jgi:hypothetical protein
VDGRRWNDRVTVFGEIVAGENGPQVRLDSDDVAQLRSDPGLEPQIGYRGEFVLEGRADDGRAIAAPVMNDHSGESAAAFDQEFDRLNQVLADRRGTTARSASSEEPAVSPNEASMREWVERAAGAMARVRKHRSKRSADPGRDDA